MNLVPIIILLAFAPNQSDLAEHFRTLHRNCDQAFDHKDLKGWTSIYDVTRTQLIDHKGKRQTVDQVAGEWREQFPGASSSQ